MLEEHTNRKKDKYSQGSSKKLRAAMKHKVKRTFIGCLDSIEKELKESGLPNWQEIFKRLRARILTVGNDQVRNIDLELDKYNVEFIPYKVTFKIMKEDNNG